jgi:bifunctional non-homologous end joining protein LigD
LQFNTCHSRTKSIGSPDYVIIGIDPPDTSFEKAIDVALKAKEILFGLQLPSLLKTDGKSGLHIYIPLDSKSEYETGKRLAEYICKLIRLKIPDVVTLNESDKNNYGKVSLDYLVNEKGRSIVAPYSIVPGESANVATPILWNEVKEGLQLQAFNINTIFKRLKQVDDPFKNFFKKKINADEVLERIEERYSFLF